MDKSTGIGIALILTGGMILGASIMSYIKFKKEVSKMEEEWSELEKKFESEEA